MHLAVLGNSGHRYYSRLVLSATLIFLITFLGGLPSGQLPGYLEFYKAGLAAAIAALSFVKIEEDQTPK